MQILCIETATRACSVALGRNGIVAALKESIDEKHSHSENLTLYIEEVCRQAGIQLKNIDAVAVSKGPGSFTGLRIGVSAAKGLCYALNKPLIAVNTLQAMAAGQTSLSIDQTTLLCPLLDARRMEAYCAVYDMKLTEVKTTSAEIITSGSFADLLSKNKVLFFGDGAEKCKSIILHPNAEFLDNIFPSAANMIALAEKRFGEKQFEDTAYFEPFYLKDFVSGSAQRT